MKKFALKSCIVPVCAISMAAGILLGKSMTNPVPFIIGLVLFLGAAILLKGNLRMAASAMCAVCIGISGGTLAFHPVLPAEGNYHVTAIVADSVKDGEGNQHKATLRRVSLDGKAVSSSAYWTFYSPDVPAELVPGMKISFDASLYHPGNEDNPGGFNFREYLISQGINFGIYGCENLQFDGIHLDISGTPAYLRHLMSEKLVSVLGKEAGGYAAAMLVSEKQGIPGEDRTAFSRLGIAHVLSVSGFHVGVLAGVITFILKRLHASRKTSLVTKTVVLCAYCLLTGLHAPVVRASILLLLYEYGTIRHRQKISLNLLSASAIVILLFSPAQVISSSFHLTYGAMLGMTIVLPTLRRTFRCKNQFQEKLADGFSAAMAAQIGILLPELYWYHELPLLGLLLNVVVMALSSVLICAFWVVLAVSPIPFVGKFLGKIVAVPVELLLKMARIGGSSSAVTLWTKQANWLTAVGWVCLIVSLCCFIRPKKALRIFSVLISAAIIGISLIPLPHTGTTYIQLSVGNADSAVLLSGKDVIAIDTGEDGEALSTYLHQRRKSIDTLFLTHLHLDHAGGLGTLMEDGIGIGQIVIPWGALQADISPDVVALLEKAESKGIPVVTFSRGDKLDFQEGTLTCMWPEKGKVRPNQDANMSSLVLSCNIKGTTMLFTGDLDGRYEKYAAVNSDILKIAHHGSLSSSSDEFLSIVSPEAVLISCGDMRRLQSTDDRTGEIPLYATKTMGAIMIDFFDNGCSISTMHQPE